MNIHEVSLLELIEQSAGKHRRTAETAAPAPVHSPISSNSVTRKHRDSAVYTRPARQGRKRPSLDSLLKRIKAYAE